MRPRKHQSAVVAICSNDGKWLSPHGMGPCNCDYLKNLTVKRGDEIQATTTPFIPRLS
jgi:hypothetical protein